MTLDEFFAGRPEAQAIYDAVARAAGNPAPRVSKSQVALGDGAAVWMAGRWLGREMAPLVLSLFRRDRIDSPRFKEVVEPAPGRFTHHLELWSPEDVDAEVVSWLQAAAAGDGDADRH